MVDREVRKEERKTWSAPELRRLRAGAAEQGQGTFADGGAPTNPRS